MPAKIQSAGNLSQNPQEAVIATRICFLTNFTELELTNIQTNYWWGQMHCGPYNQNFGWAMSHPAHAEGPPMLLILVLAAIALSICAMLSYCSAANTVSVTLCRCLLQLGPWLAVEIPDLISKGLVQHKDSTTAN